MCYPCSHCGRCKKQSRPVTIRCPKCKVKLGEDMTCPQCGWALKPPGGDAFNASGGSADEKSA